MVKRKQNDLRLPFVVVAVPFFAPVFYTGVKWGFLCAVFCAAILVGVCCLVYVCIFVLSKKTCFSRIKNILRGSGFRFCAAVFCTLILSFFALNRFFVITAPLLTLISEDEICLLSGKALSSPVRTEKGNYLLTFEAESAASERIRASATGRVKLLLGAELVEAYYPGRLYTQALKKNEDNLPPFIEKGAHFTVNVKSLGKGLFLAQKTSETIWKSHSDLIRARFRLYLKRILYVWGNAGGFLLALLSGSREYLDPLLSQAFKKAGLAHILALSGMHLSLFGGLSAYLARIAAGKKCAVLIAIVSMCAFVWFAGSSPSLLRALFCACLLSAASFCSLKPSALHALCASFIIQTVVFPSDAVELSFLLSYAALFGIVTFGKLIASRLPLSKMIANPLAASCGAQLSTAPISAAVFSCLTPAGIPASIVVSPLASIFLCAGLFCLLASLVFPVLLHPLGFIMRFLYECVRLPVLIFAKIPSVIF